MRTVLSFSPHVMITAHCCPSMKAFTVNICQVHSARTIPHPVIFSDSLQSRLTGTVTAGSSAVLSAPSANNVIATVLQRQLFAIC